MSGNWVGGERFVKVKTYTNKKGGNSGPVGKRKQRGYRLLMQALAQNLKGRKGR